MGVQVASSSAVSFCSGSSAIPPSGEGLYNFLILGCPALQLIKGHLSSSSTDDLGSTRASRWLLALAARRDAGVPARLPLCAALAAGIDLLLGQFKPIALNSRA